MLVIACLDCPRLTQVPGSDGRDLFIVRSPGNIVPPFGAGLGGEAASIEHAVEVLGVREVVVLGHTGCTVMRRLVEPPAKVGFTAMEAFLRHADGVRRQVDASAGRIDRVGRVDMAARLNVVAQLANLRTHPAILLRQHTSDRVTVHGRVLQIETGEYLTYAPAKDRFLPIAR